MPARKFIQTAQENHVYSNAQKRNFLGIYDEILRPLDKVSYLKMNVDIELQKYQL